MKTTAQDAQRVSVGACVSAAALSGTGARARPTRWVSSDLPVSHGVYKLVQGPGGYG